MNELQIEAMERKLQEMQEQLSEMKKAKEEGKVSHDAMLPDSGCFWLNVSNFEPCGGDFTSAKDNTDQNIFPSEEVAKAYGDAFRVMLELHRCEGGRTLL